MKRIDYSGSPKVIIQLCGAVNYLLSDSGGGSSGGETTGGMSRDVYDSNANSIVDDSEKVNGYTVTADVPGDAVFTDTIIHLQRMEAQLLSRIPTGIRRNWYGTEAKRGAWDMR